MSERRLEPTDAPFQVIYQVPGDKSLSHRALILAAMAQGTSQVDHLGTGRDVASTRRALDRLGIRFEDGRILSPGIEAWEAASAPLDCGNSGTTMRLLAGALAGRPFASTLTGDASLRRRPMRRLVEPLQALGATVTVSDAGTPHRGGAATAERRRRRDCDRLGAGSLGIRARRVAGRRPLVGAQPAWIS